VVSSVVAAQVTIEEINKNNSQTLSKGHILNSRLTLYCDIIVMLLIFPVISHLHSYETYFSPYDINNLTTFTFTG